MIRKAGWARALSRHAGNWMPRTRARLALRHWSATRRAPRSRGEWLALASAEPLWLASDHGRIAGWRWPAHARGTAERVLLVHGWNGRGGQLHRFVTPLRDAGFEVLTCDAPGHGDSDGEHSSLFAFDAMLDALNERYPVRAVIAHSFGAIAALMWLRERTPIRATITLAAPHDFEILLERYAESLQLSTAVRAAMRERLEALHGADLFDRASPLANARALRARMLVIHDRDDRLVPPASGRMLARAAPHSELLETTRLGHDRILRDASVIAAACRFLSR